MKTLIKLIVPLLLGTLVACGDPNAGPVTVSPKSVTVKAGEKTTLTASVQDAEQTRIIWSVEGGDDSGTITSSGVYTAPAKQGTYTVVAINAFDSSKTDKATITVEPVMPVTVEPTSPTVDQGETVAFSASVAGSSDAAVDWAVEGGEANGTITSSGIYTPPAKEGTYTVVATSAADPAKKASVTVTVRPVAVTITPGSQNVPSAGSIVLYASVAGTRGDSTVTWSVRGGDANGTITPTGVYTAPTQSGTYTVIATSVADPSKTAISTLTVTPVDVVIVPGDQSTYTTGSVSFSASVTGTAGNKAVNWSVEGGDDHGTITNAGVYTAPTSGGTFTVVATSVADPAKKATAQVTVSQVAVKVSATDTTLDQGATTALSVEVTGAPSPDVMWTVAGLENGEVSPDGVYTAPDKKGTFTVTATSVTDPTKRASVELTVRDVVITLTPAAVTLTARAEQTFSATVTGTTRKDVSWSVGGGDSRGSITKTGIYTAPAAAGRFTVVATNTANRTKQASAVVTVPAASSGITYEDPAGNGWKLVKNTGLSTTNRLVLDLVAPAGAKSRGVDLSLIADAPRASWAKLASGDSEYALNHVFDLGSGPQLFRSTVKDSDLSLGVFQKGTAAPAASSTGAVLSVAVDLKTGPTLPTGAVRLAVTKAHSLSESGTLGPIDVAVGKLTAK
ncbi:hypothetical protein [Archangium sp.]|uniref:hypothetical protein n=1 Tax=Archangium sp. TaxID=1872627 RepID=UPI0038999C68